MCSRNRALLFWGIFFSGTLRTSGQPIRKVLFLGNSYTYANDLPQMIARAAASAGKTLIYDSHAPGSYYLGQHLTNEVSLSKIAAGGWDHIVLQDQSMALAYPATYLNFLQYSVQLDSFARIHSLCNQTMFYGTWGRKNGDSYLCTPPECAVDTWIHRTYFEMDSAITSHYKAFADSLKASMTPVGAVWRYIRRTYPSIELFQADESHPSQAGTYAAACSFYATLFRSDPGEITFNPGLPAAEAADIREAARRVVYSHLRDWNIGVYDSLLDARCRAVGTGERAAVRDYWTVTPNPVADVLCLRFHSGGVKGKITLCNALGNAVLEANATPVMNISVKALPAGIYFLRASYMPQVLKVLKL